MLSKYTITILANQLSQEQSRQYCMDLDKKLEQSLRKAFEGMRVSKERQNTIVNTFCNNLLGGE